MGNLLSALSVALVLVLPLVPSVAPQASSPVGPVVQAVTTPAPTLAIVPPARAVEQPLLPVPPTETIPEAQQAAEQRVLDLLNAARAEHQLPPLQIDLTLVAVARAHSQDMEIRNYFSHWEPDETHRSPVDRYAAVLGHIPTIVVGENLGTYDHPDFEVIHQALMNSPAHRANILDSAYTWVGIGVLTREDGQTWVTQMFRGGSEKAG